jgi:flavin-dependent dehydrogenase
VESLTERRDEVVVTVDGPQGSYSLTAAYVVGCDGTRSTVRRSAGIPFEGSEFTALGALGDVRLTDPPDNPVTSAWSVEGTFMMVPFPDGTYRVSVHSPEDVRTDWPGQLTVDELRTRIRSITGTDFGMHSASWLSRFGNTARLASRYRQGRVLLAGDAAHQHMPAGGVGLNVGIQDAMNLGWKLAAAINEQDRDGLLDTYDAERRPVGADTIEHTQAQTAIMMTFSPQGQALRSLFGKLLAEQPQLNGTLAERLAGLAVRYPAPQNAHPLTGRRAPNLALSAQDRLFPLLRNGGYMFMDFARTPRRFSLEGIDGRVNHYRCAHPPTPPRPDWSNVSAALIRPDGYIAWASNETGSDTLVTQAQHVLANPHATIAEPPR